MCEKSYELYAKSSMIVMFAASPMSMVVATQDTMRDPVGNKIDFAAVCTVNHFFGQVSTFMIVDILIDANNAFYFMRKSHQVVSHNHDSHGIAKFRKHVIERLNASNINIVGGFVQEKDFRITHK